MWAECRAQADERLLELADFFSGTKALTRVGKDAQLQEWFGQLATQVRALDSADATSAGRKMHHMIGALSEVEQFHQIEAALQIKQFLQETRELLQRMIRVVNVRESTLVTLSVVSDMSYAWESIDDYTELMRSRIERDPFCVLKLRATFLKLVSILDSRPHQSGELARPSVSQYYSSELVAYVRRVLQVIPERMFAILFEVVQLQAHELAQLPVKVVRTELSGPSSTLATARATPRRCWRASSTCTRRCSIKVDEGSFRRHPPGDRASVVLALRTCTSARASRRRWRRRWGR